MKTRYELPGGVVTRESENKWRVNAPDGRPVGTFRTRTLALQKAEHWDKWDALASLQDISVTMAPFMTTHIMTMLGSMKDGEVGYMPTDEQLTQAAILDTCVHIMAQILRNRGTTRGQEVAARV